MFMGSGVGASSPEMPRHEGVHCEAQQAVQSVVPIIAWQIREPQEIQISCYRNHHRPAQQPQHEFHQAPSAAEPSGLGPCTRQPYHPHFQQRVHQSLMPRPRAGSGPRLGRNYMDWARGLQLHE
jgi:hypothetical protein